MATGLPWDGYSCQLPSTNQPWTNSCYSNSGSVAVNLPHIHSIMMKTEGKDDSQLYKPAPLAYMRKVDQDGDEYRPMHDTLADFYGNSTPMSTNDPSSSYLHGQVTYAVATPMNTYYEMPHVSFTQMTAYPSEYDAPVSVPAPIYAPSPAYSPPPQDPLVTKPKKRIAAVPCHSNSICANCKTKETTLWRRNHVGEIECNACNLYYRKNNRKRPLSLRKDGILKRNRKPRCESPQHPRS